MAAKTNPVSKASDREIVIERVVNAPREAVWRALTDPKQIAQWWGPNGFTNTHKRMEVKAGGVWEFTMHGPDGTDYPNRIVYHEVVEPERLSYSHGGGNEGHDDADFEATIRLSAEGPKTRVTLRSVFKTAAEREHVVKKYGAIEGAKQTLGRLDMHLALAKPSFLTLKRTFDAPREKVWAAWTQPSILSKWFAPDQFTIPRCEMDVRPAGTIRLDMKGPDGAVYPMTGVYQKVDAPRQLIYTAQPFGPDGKPQVDMVQVITLEAKGAKTELTWAAHIISATPMGEMMLQGMEPGANMSLDHLARELAGGNTSGSARAPAKSSKA